VRLKRLDNKVTRWNVRDFIECLCGILRPDRLAMRSDSYPTGLKSHFSALDAAPHFIFT
jgi:hypothetical protein